ncbi:MAG TPA: TIGR00341 family protein [Desulfobulbus sp.]|nr:TIGR00341 family protein [Desulfobulbus sp.]
MEQRLIEITLPEGKGDDIPELLHAHPAAGFWRDTVGEHQARIRILLNQSEVEPVLDILEPYLEELPDAAALLLIVEASIPRKRFARLQQNRDNADTDEEDEQKPSDRLSRHELYSDIASNVDTTSTYLYMVVLSAIIAAVGLLRNDMAIIIGAMVLAPLLIPNVALALASTLGDTELAGKALKTGAIGFFLALATGVLIGFITSISPQTPAILARTSLDWGDIILALASGAAGVLAFTSGGHLSLIGVMVAVALMPPLVTAGLLFGNSMILPGIKALELAFANVICINLAGIVTFILQGIRPATWWENSKAGKAKRVALVAWLALLILLALIVFR